MSAASWPSVLFQLLLYATRVRRLLPNWFVTFAVAYCTSCFCVVTEGVADAMPLVAGLTVRVILVRAGWSAPKNHILSRKTGPPADTPGSNRSFVSFGYVWYSACVGTP